MTRIVKIIICDECEGYGRVGRKELISENDYGKDWDTWSEECKVCKGTGRVMINAEIINFLDNGLYPDRED